VNGDFYLDTVANKVYGPKAAGAWPAGAWRVRWQVLAVDGHITRGDIPFTLRAP
jgi:methionine-rich copper-binding protein CopC